MFIDFTGKDIQIKKLNSSCEVLHD